MEERTIERPVLPIALFTVSQRFDVSPRSPISDEQSQKDAESLEKLAGWLEMLMQYLMQAAFMCRGNVDDAVHWILTGRTQSGTKPWTTEEDEVLYADEANCARIEEARGSQAVGARQKFLADIQLMFD